MEYEPTCVFLTFRLTLCCIRAICPAGLSSCAHCPSRPISRTRLPGPRTSFPFSHVSRPPFSYYTLSTPFRLSMLGRLYLSLIISFFRAPLLHIAHLAMLPTLYSCCSLWLLALFLFLFCLVSLFFSSCAIARELTASYGGWACLASVQTLAFPTSCTALRYFWVLGRVFVRFIDSPPQPGALIPCLFLSVLLSIFAFITSAALGTPLTPSSSLSLAPYRTKAPRATICLHVLLPATCAPGAVVPFVIVVLRVLFGPCLTSAPAFPPLWAGVLLRAPYSGAASASHSSFALCRSA